MVFDYVAGKLDWLANDLPVAGKLAETPTIGKLARRNVPTCQPMERLSDVRNRLHEAGWNICVVVNDARVVLGLVHEDAAGGEDPTVEQRMELGPTTFRPYLTVEQIADYIQRKNSDTVVITTSDGRLVGALRKEDLHRET
jgi:CBS domain-containing protein